MNQANEHGMLRKLTETENADSAQVALAQALDGQVVAQGRHLRPVLVVFRRERAGPDFSVLILLPTNELELLIRARGNRQHVARYLPREDNASSRM